MSGTGTWATHRGLRVTVKSCAASWDQASHRCPAREGAVLHIGDRDVSTAPSGPIEVLRPGQASQLQVSIEIDPAAAGSGSFQVTTTAAGQLSR